MRQESQTCLPDLDTEVLGNIMRRRAVFGSEVARDMRIGFDEADEVLVRLVNKGFVRCDTFDEEAPVNLFSFTDRGIEFMEEKHGI